MMISSTPFIVKLGLRDQGVSQVWKTNWSWQFQWTSSCCSCMVLERILDVHLLPFKLCLMKSASMPVYLHKMLATWHRFAFTGWILNQRRPTMTFHHSSTKVWRWNGLVNFPRNLEEDEASQQLQEGDFSFNFLQQGQTVAVFYDRDFYVGQVLQLVQVHNPDCWCHFHDQHWQQYFQVAPVRGHWPSCCKICLILILKLCPRTGHGKLTV